MSAEITKSDANFLAFLSSTRMRTIFCIDKSKRTRVSHCHKVLEVEIGSWFCHIPSPMWLNHKTSFLSLFCCLVSNIWLLNKLAIMISCNPSINSWVGHWRLGLIIIRFKFNVELVFVLIKYKTSNVFTRLPGFNLNLVHDNTKTLVHVTYCSKFQITTMIIVASTFSGCSDSVSADTIRRRS